MSDLTTYRARVEKFYADSIAKAKDGLTLTEAGQILQGFVLLNVDAAVDLDNDGAAKKSIVMQWVLDLYDKMIAYLPLPMWLAWVKWPGVSGALRSLVAQWISGQIESALEWIKQTRAAIETPQVFTVTVPKLSE